MLKMVLDLEIDFYIRINTIALIELEAMQVIQMTILADRINAK